MPKEAHEILTDILVCFLPGQTKDLSAPLYEASVRASMCVCVCVRVRVRARNLLLRNSTWRFSGRWSLHLQTEAPCDL